MNDLDQRKVIVQTLSEAQTALTRLLSDDTTLGQIAKASVLLSNVAKSRQTIFSCGNGGSMCDAMHFAEELTGRFREDRPAIAAVAISDPGHLSCVANDFGYDRVFSRYLEAHGRKGDVLLAISTSGSSKNVLEAAKKAHDLGMKVIGLTGKTSCALASHSDILIATPGGAWADRVQELHIKVIHILIDLVEKQLA